MRFETTDRRIVCVGDEGTQLGYVEFEQMRPGVVDVTHTFVEPAGRGQGIADRLTLELANRLREKRLRAQLSCSYAQRWFARHPEFADVLA